MEHNYLILIDYKKIQTKGILTSMLQISKHSNNFSYVACTMNILRLTHDENKCVLALTLTLASVVNYDHK